MTSKTIVCVLLVFSVFATVRALKCYDIDAASGEVECPLGYCYMETKIIGDHGNPVHPSAQRCATKVELSTIRTDELNRWLKEGNNFIQICNFVRDSGGYCNSIDYLVTDVMSFIVFGSDSVCYSSDDVGLLLCNRLQCEYSKNLDTGIVFMGCAPPTDKVGKCFKQNNELKYICKSNMCNYADVCEFYTDPTTTTRVTPKQDLNKTSSSTEPTSSATKKRKRRKRKSNTGNRFSVPTVAMLMVVVGVYFTF
uniref:Uncharacterized protein n=1 Tax=Panagrellus redivivus TaxID=6233 RepID=A0A7E4ZT38_PANRE